MPIAADTEIVPRDGNFSRTRREIEQTNRLRAVGEILDQHEFIAGLALNFGLLAERILIHLDDFGVAEHVQRERVELGHVATENERRGHERLHTHVAVLLVRSERRLLALAHAVRVADPTDEDVIRIVPRAGLGKFPMVRVAEGDVVKPRQARSACQPKITGGAPAIANFAASFPHVAHAVLAEVENDVAILFLEFAPHEPVRKLETRQIFRRLPVEGNVRRVRVRDL
jgi:hypothetical protein